MHIITRAVSGLRSKPEAGAAESVFPRSTLLVAAVALFCAVAWLWLNVAFNYDGHLTGLYYTGASAELPLAVAETTHRVMDEAGYDGQYYHLVAHDPLIRRDFSQYIDNPRLRWRRIGVPGLAALLSGGADAWVDFAFVGIQLLFVGLGALWLSQYARRQGAHPAWGLAFLLVPAVAVSLDRMTIDLPLAALAIGFVLYGTLPDPTGVRSRWPVYAILLAAPLVRETGALLIAGWCLYSVVRRDWRGTILGAACGVPSVVWWAYVHSHTPVDGTAWLSSYPFSGIIERTMSGIDAPVYTLWLRVASAFESAALAGIWLALVLAVYLAWKRRWGLIELTAITFAVFAATLGRFDIWSSAYATGRTMSPLLIMLGLLALRPGARVFALPLLFVLPRIALQYEAQFRQSLRGIF